jgi:MoxR-like ATPase
MEESQVTVGGTTYPLERPFMVMATQNPIEMEGTYPLPEAQRDRFMARISMGYPSAPAEMDMLLTHGGNDPLDALPPATDAATIAATIGIVQRVYASPALRQYVVDLVSATRSTPALRLGASPRASLHLLRASRAHAAVAGRDHVLPDDVRQVAQPVLAHRFIVATDSAGVRRPDQVLRDLLGALPVPTSAR